MTLQDLSKVYQLSLRRDKQIEMLESLRASSPVGAVQITGMPSGHGISDKTGNVATALADLELSILDITTRMDFEIAKVESFISGIEDAYIRTLFRLRFLQCMTWPEIAGTLRGASEDSVKKIVYRYLESVDCPNVT